MELKHLVNRYPRIYHMAENGTWPSIKEKGLLSASATLDHFNVEKKERFNLEKSHRKEKVFVGTNCGIVLRDQKPMPPSRLKEALTDGCTPEQWYSFLNGRVFMWAKEERLFGLLSAREYRHLEHDVLTIDSASLLSQYEPAVWLCHMNSGNTWPFPHKRCLGDFKRIADYPVKRRAESPQKEVVEILVDYSVPDISKFVLEVRRMRGESVLAQLSL